MVHPVPSPFRSYRVQCAHGWGETAEREGGGGGEPPWHILIRLLFLLRSMMLFGVPSLLSYFRQKADAYAGTEIFLSLPLPPSTTVVFRQELKAVDIYTLFRRGTLTQVDDNTFLSFFFLLFSSILRVGWPQPSLHPSPLFSIVCVTCGGGPTTYTVKEKFTNELLKKSLRINPSPSCISKT